MNLLHFFAIDWNGIGGPHQCVPRLVQAQNHIHDVNAAFVMTSNNREETPDFGFPVFDLRQVFDKNGRIVLPAPFDRPDLVILQSTYIPAHAKVARQLRRLGIPYIVCPHGGLTRLAQNSKWLKKRLGNLVFLNKMVSSAAAIHHLTHQEAEASKGWGRPTMVVGNGVDLPEVSELATPGESQCRRFLFVGRLAIDHKGLDLLLDACEQTRSQWLASNSRMEIYGPDWHGSSKWLSDCIACKHLQEIVFLGGPIRGEDKHRAFQQADVFVHTSRWEGHPIAVLEAFSYGVPCLVTPGTNMADEIDAAGAGWKVEPSVRDIAEGIDRVLSAKGHELREAGIRARKLAIEEYAWDTIGKQTVDAYRQWAA